jgi:hypothetical protein
MTMTIDTSIGLDDPRAQESGIDDEARARKARRDGQSVTEEAPKPDITSEDIESGNDRNVSADQGNRSGRTNKLTDDSIEIGKP